MKTSYRSRSLLALIGAAAFAPHLVQAAAYTVDCGAGGSTAALQTQIVSIGSTPNNQIVVLGTCVGDVDVSRANQLTISGLSLTGSLRMQMANSLRFTSLTINGPIQIFNTRNTTFSATTVRGEIFVTRGSQVSFTTLTSSPWTDDTGTRDPAFNCSGQSECTLSFATLIGTGTSNTSAGVLAASGARLNYYGGTITGFGTGLQSWNNATAFVFAICDPIVIGGNRVAGVSVFDGGIAKVYGASALEAAANECAVPGPVMVQIGGNGNYGVLVDGGGNAYLKGTRISGHTRDGVRVQHGSVVRVRGSQIDAATSSGRSARVKAQSHLYFDEQEEGPAAGSTLAGPVCVTGTSSVDAENSSTVLVVQRSCAGP